MATHIITRRIQYIIQYIYDFDYPSKEKILEFLEEKDFNISPRTLERDLERIRADFGLEIAYKKQFDGYYIDEDKSIRVDSFFKFLEIVSLADIFSKSLIDSNRILDYVSFDDSSNFKGIDNLKDILIGLNQNRTLSFVHENFEKESYKNYEITPLRLKEYENRWYVIGVPFGMKEFRIFGVDRITNIKLGESIKIKKSRIDSQLKAFDNIIGLTYNVGEPVSIRLLVNEIHVKYLQSLPLHKTQSIHSKNDKGQYFVDFFLAPNYEFKMQILKMGEYAVVLEPVELRNEIKSILDRIIQNYI